MTTAALTGGLLVLSAAAADVHAGSATYVFQNATGFCQPALPVFEGNIRKRPTAIANEGTSNAFVSCSMQTNPDSPQYRVEQVVLVLYNRTGAAASVTCSMVNGFQAGGPVHPQEQVVPGGDRQFYTWNAADIGETTLQFANFNCNLPPGLDIGYGFYQRYDIVPL
jgi:hypothetical protein